MQPRNKFQREIASLSPAPYSEKAKDSIFNPLTDKQKKWAFDKCLDHKGYATKNRTICMDCGEVFPTKIVKRNRATCPHCQTKLKVEFTYKRKFRQREYVALAEIHKGYQVIRHFELDSWHTKGKPADCSYREILQYWIREDGKYEMIGHCHHQNLYIDSWGSDWSIRKDHRYYSHYAGKYNIYPYKYIPGSRFKRKYTMYGINRNVAECLTILDAIRIVPTNSMAETLLKAKQYALLYYMGTTTGGESRVRDYWPSIRIALRNKYKIKDASMYFDYLEFLVDFKKDLRNPVFVCPKDLKKSHDYYDKIVKKRSEQERARRRYEEDMKRYAKEKYLEKYSYRERKKPYLGMKFSYKDVTIKFMNSVAQIKRESELLNHCAYSRKYQDRDTLIFSVRVSGTIVATAEVDPVNGQVLQCRGKQNLVTEYDQLATNILRKNMKKIVDRVKEVPKLEAA